VFEVQLAGRTLAFPYAKSEPSPSGKNPVHRVFVDPEIGREGFTFELHSGQSGTVHVEQVLEYNEDPAHLRDQLLYKLTLEARKRIANPCR
jgi:hypothetical protein